MPVMTADGRLRSRPGAPPAPPPGPGVHPVGEGALLVVPSGGGPYDLLVFFHGAGGDASSSLSLVGAAAGTHRLLVLLTSSVGSTWDVVTGGPGPDVQRLDDALADVFSAHEVRRLAFGGFSDGASYALSLGVANGDLAEALLAFSPGFLAPPAQVGRPRVWVSHGTVDRVLPVDRCGRRVVATLRAAGHDVDYVEFEGGHVVPPELVDAAVRHWLGD